MEQRVIKFRCWTGSMMEQWDHIRTWESLGHHLSGSSEFKWMQFTGLQDKHDNEIYEGDILEFSDKWEWYKGSYGIKMWFADPEKRKELQEKYDAEPMERRVIEIPSDYEWLLSSEIQTYWQVVGNICEHPELLKDTQR